MENKKDRRERNRIAKDKATLGIQFNEEIQKRIKKMKSRKGIVKAILMTYIAPRQVVEAT